MGRGRRRRLSRPKPDRVGIRSDRTGILRAGMRELEIEPVNRELQNRLDGQEGNKSCYLQERHWS